MPLTAEAVFDARHNLRGLPTQEQPQDDAVKAASENADKKFQEYQEAVRDLNAKIVQHCSNDEHSGQKAADELKSVENSTVNKDVDHQHCAKDRLDEKK